MPDFDAARRAIYAYLLRQTHDAALADDMTQEVLLKLHHYLTQLRQPDNYLAWLKKTAYTTLMDHYRRQRGQAVPTPGEALPEVAEPAAAEENDPPEFYSCVRALMLGLEPAQREALELVALHNVPQADIARRLGLPLSTVKSRVQRAKQRIRSQLSQHCALQTDPYGNVLDYRLPEVSLPAAASV